jgi:hypothetical protein
MKETNTPIDSTNSLAGVLNEYKLMIAAKRKNIGTK